MKDQKQSRTINNNIPVHQRFPIQQASVAVMQPNRSVESGEKHSNELKRKAILSLSWSLLRWTNSIGFQLSLNITDFDVLSQRTILPFFPHDASAIILNRVQVLVQYI